LFHVKLRQKFHVKLTLYRQCTTTYICRLMIMIIYNSL